MKQQIEKVNQKVSDKVERTELAKFDSALRKWSGESFAEKSAFKLFALTTEKQMARIDGLEDAQGEVGNQIEKMVGKVQRELGAKASASEMDRRLDLLSTQHKKLATVDEFQELYEQVVPPAEQAQANMEEYMREHEQMKQVINAIDSTMGAYALKHEIIEYSKELRAYLKTRPFEDYRVRTDQRIADLTEESDQLKTSVSAVDKRIEEEVHRRVRIAFENQKVVQQ